jgi:hypothetical protein
MAIINFDCHQAGGDYPSRKSLAEVEADATARCAAEGGQWIGGQADHSGLTIFTWKTYVGLCVADREMNGYDDSDFYMTVYEPATDSFSEIMFATTRGWSYPAMGSSPDATAEVAEKYRAHLAKLAEAACTARAAAEAATPCKGKTLRVVSGRKLPVGTVGECIWYGAGKSYSPSRWAPVPMRVGIRTQDGAVLWTAAGNVVVV